MLRRNIIEQISYNHWANLRLIQITSKLDNKGINQQVTSSFSSVRQTWVHILWAEELWLERWQGRSFVPSLDPDDFPTSDQIKSKLDDLYSKQVHFFETIISGQEDQIVSYVNFKNEKWEFRLGDMVHHLLFHSAYHRGQLVTMLRQLGLQPPGTDYLLFIDEKS